MPDHSDLDIEGETRAAVLWALSGRSISLGYALITQVEAGFGVETYPIARTIHEVNMLIRVFVQPEGDEILRAWLRGHQPKASRIRSLILRIEARDDARRQADGLPPIDPDNGMYASLYEGLSSATHTTRESILSSISPTRRLMLMGPSPDWYMRAYFTGHCGEVIWEIAWVVSHDLTYALGEDLGQGIFEGIEAWLNEVDESHPLPEEQARRSPL